jgi:hypothetical protein
MKACEIQMAKKPETNVKELKPDLEESTTQFRSLLCNKEYHTGIQ